MLVMLANIAAEDGPPMLRQVRDALADGNCSEAARTGHALKGLLSTFESGSPVDELQPMIDAARLDDIGTARQAHETAAPKLEKLMSEIETLARGSESNA